MRFAWTLLIAGTLLGSACAPKPRVAMRDKAAWASVKKIAVLPFFDADFLTHEHRGGPYAKTRRNWSRDFTREAAKALPRHTFLSGDDVRGALMQVSAYSDYDKEQGRAFRAGFTIAEAVAAGKELGADAVLMGAASKNDGKRRGSLFSTLFLEAMTVRLVDVSTGKVVWGGAHIKRGFNAGDTIRTLVKALAGQL